MENNVNEAFKVECISTRMLSKEKVNKPKVELGEEYRVHQVHTCKCGEQHYDVGLVSKLNYVTCHKCDEVLPNSAINGVHWAHSSRFNRV